MSEHVQVGVEDGVLTLRLARPDKKNAIDRSMYAAMTAALERANGDDAVGAILIGGVPGAFSSGNDIADFVAIASGKGDVAELGRFLHALTELDKPLVAAVDGLAVGIGTTLLLHCDLAFATPRSVFRTPFIDLGLVPEAASSLLGPRLMGHQRAFALLAMGETFDAAMAREAGLIYALADDAETQALAAARRLAAKPREALGIARRLMRGDRGAVRERLELEGRHFAERLRSEEARAAFAAFMNRA